MLRSRRSTGDVVQRRPEGGTRTDEHGRVWKELPSVDVCFVFDTTGSMSNKIDGLITCMEQLVDQLGDVGLDWRVSVVPFGDLTVPGDRIDSRTEWVYTVRAAKRMLRTMPRFSGGSNVGESSVEAMLEACAKPFRPVAVKVIILLTDEPAVSSSRGGPAQVHRALNALDAACFTVATDTRYYRDWATEHAGVWQPIGQTADTAQVVAMLRGLLTRVVHIAASVQQTGDSSVRAYLDRTDRRA